VATLFFIEKIKNVLPSSRQKKEVFPFCFSGSVLILFFIEKFIPLLTKNIDLQKIKKRLPSPAFAGRQVPSKKIIFSVKPI
jgi:AhpD family alkylhydroperoxidase